jgi:hypothetical protein
MKGEYILRWFDILISDTLSPNRIELATVSKAQVALLRQIASTEKRQIADEINAIIFHSKKEETIRLLARNYYTILNILLNTCAHYEQSPPFNENTNLRGLLLETKTHIQEILSLIVERLSIYLPMGQFPESTGNPIQGIAIPKLLFNLSVDQIAIITRAAFDTKVLKSKSLNELFRCIASHISTNQRTDVSYKSMRSKSYSIESIDKEVVLNVLQDIAEAVRSY